MILDHIKSDYGMVLDEFNMNIESFVDFCKKCISEKDNDLIEPEINQNIQNHDINDFIFHLMNDKNSQDTKLIPHRSLLVKLFFLIKDGPIQS